MGASGYAQYGQREAGEKKPSHGAGIVLQRASPGKHI